MGPVFVEALFIFFGYVVVHIFISRITNGGFLIRNAAITFVGYFSVLLPLFFRANIMGLSLAIVFEILFWSAYIIALVCAINSVSLRMMDDILQSTELKLSLEQLTKGSGDENSIEPRIRLMERNGWLSIDATEEIRLSSSAKLLAIATLALRRIFKLDH